MISNCRPKFDRLEQEYPNSRNLVNWQTQLGKSLVIMGGRGSGWKKFDFSGNFTKIIDFSEKIFEKFRFFQVISQRSSIFQGTFLKNFDFSRQFPKKFWFSRQKLAIYSYFWVNYSISLQKSPLWNIYFLYMIRYNNILPPVNDPCDPHDPSYQNLGVATPTPRIDAYGERRR